jgi:hypothetical protein
MSRVQGSSQSLCLAGLWPRDIRAKERLLTDVCILPYTELKHCEIVVGFGQGETWSRYLCDVVMVFPSEVRLW